MNKKDLTILIVDDNPVDVRLIREALKETGRNNETVVVQDGEEAVNYLKKTGKYAGAPKPDIILLDLKMPRMNGQEVLEIIKKDPETKSIPVIVLTTSDAEIDIKKSYDLSANCFITKPLNIDDFFDVIKSLDKLWFDKVSLPDNQQ